MSEEIINRVANSSLVSIDIEELIPANERVAFDMSECLYMGLILKEAEFREFVKTHDWNAYAGKFVTVYCSADAIVPAWAYMLVATALAPVATRVFYGPPSLMEREIVKFTLRTMDITPYVNAKVIVKGCSALPVPEEAFLEIAQKLLPHVATLMYGEPCSSVPVYKRKKMPS